MTFGARNGKLWQQTNCQDSKLASSFSPTLTTSCNYVLANFWISDNFGSEAFLGLDIRCTLLEKDSRSKGMKYQDVKKMFHIVGPFTTKESFMFDVAKYSRTWKRLQQKFSFSFCTKIINITIWLFLCADIWTFWRAETLRIYQRSFKIRKASQLKVEI